MPRQLHSDQGKNVESKLILLAGIDKSKTTPFHLRSDGQAERLNRTLLQMFRTTAIDHVNIWPSYVPTVLSAYRTTVHSVTGITPNKEMLGREVLTSDTLIAQPPNERTTSQNGPRLTPYQTHTLACQLCTTDFLKIWYAPPTTF